MLLLNLSLALNKLFYDEGEKSTKKLIFYDIEGFICRIIHQK